MRAPTVLSVGEATALASALAQAIAARMEIRTLLVKGETLHRYGLRPPRVSADVDVLIEPTKYDIFCSALQLAGWMPRLDSAIGQFTHPHSQTFAHPNWPCDIDAHAYFPGFLRNADDVFECLWARRQFMDIAHYRCAVPDRASSFLIQALHSLRSSDRIGRHVDELEHLTTIILDVTEKQSILALAMATGSAWSLDEFLRDIDILVTEPPPEELRPALRDWRVRVQAGSSGAYFWYRRLRNASGCDKAGVVWRALWPTTDDLRISDPNIGPGIASVLSTRAKRLARGIGGLPRTIRALYGNR